MIFDLVKDFADVLDAMPEEHPRRRILNLLDEDFDLSRFGMVNALQNFP